MRRLRALMQQGVEDGVFPGAVLLVTREGSIVFLEAFGLARLDPKRPMTTETVFDLASLTKPLATAVSVMMLVQQATLKLDQTLGSTISDFSGTDKKDITVRQLLSHRSGLPDYQPYYEKLTELLLPERENALRTLLVKEDLIHKPGHVCLYSDLGFMLLEWLIEVVAEGPLDHFVEQSIYKPLGLKDLFFNRFTPTQPSPIKGEGLNGGHGRGNRAFAATQDCPWRGEILDGEVDDDNAYALGGVAGHAGLFGTAQDVYSLLQELLNTYVEKTNAGLFRQDVVKTFFQRQPKTGSWALGFDTPTLPDSSSGKHFSENSVGHLGFVGTSFWMDLDREVIVVLLTNRIHPTRKNEKIKAFRPLIHDVVMAAVLSKG